MPETYSRPPRSLADATDPREFVRFGQLDRTKLYAQPAIAVRTTSGNLTAVVGDLIVADCANGALVVSPPANPADGDRVSLLKVDNTANLLTFNAPTHADPVCEFQGRWSGATLIWSATMSCWLVWSTNVAAMGLTQDVGDSRYAFKSHAHAGSDITSGTVPFARLPVAANGAVDAAGVLSAADGRVAPLFAPEDHALKAWVCDVYMANANKQIATNGNPECAIVEVRESFLLTTIHYNVFTAGATMTSNSNRIGVYRLSDRALVAQTGDLSSVWTSPGVKSSAVVSQVTLAPGFYYVAFISNASTRPNFITVNNWVGQLGRTLTTNPRGGTVTAAAYTTTLPSTLPSFSTTPLTLIPWAALS